MKLTILSILALAVPLAVFSESAEYPKLRADFDNPPKENKIETWWHFTTNAITKEGITADLEAMKAIGYGGAHAFFLCSQNPSFAPLEILDSKWNEMMKHAGTEASRLGLRLGAHNCPGWSSSGGPWIKPEDSMQYVVASNIRLQGPYIGELKLPQPQTVAGFYRDIAVIAFPVGNSMPTPKISGDIPNIQNVVGENENVSVLPLAKKGATSTIVFEFNSAYHSKYAEIRFDDVRLYVHAEISVSDDGIRYSKVGEYNASTYNDKKTPKLVKLNRAVGRFYKFEFKTAKSFQEWERPRNVSLKNIRLVAENMVYGLDNKTSLSNRFAYIPPIGGIERERGVQISSMRNLTPLFSNGTGKVSLPDGKWIVLRIGHTSTGATNAPSSLKGLECDKLSRRGLDAHWPFMMKKLEADFGTAMRYATIDSYEVGGQNWTTDFAEQFKKLRGYDIRPWLPAMVGFVVNTEDETAKFFFDLQRTVSDLMARNYYDYFGELCRRDGLISIVEPYGGMFDSLRCVRNIDIPTGEFWIKNKAPARMTGSAAHLLGKPRAGAESFTTLASTGRWLQTPAQLKEYGDRAWIHGISSIIVHTYTHQPFTVDGPAMTLGVNGTHMTRLNTWWKFGDAWVSYINRAQSLLQRGEYVADVLIMSGDGSPNLAWYRVYDEITAAGFDYDYCSADDVAELLRVRNGKIFAAENGTKYSLLTLGSDKFITLRTLRAVEKLLREGAKIAAARPLGSPSLSDNPKEYADIVRRIWGEGKEKVRSIGRGFLYATSNTPTALKLAGIVPDFEMPAGVRTIHRRDGTLDIYFMANLSDDSVEGYARFRIPAGKIPQIFDPTTGSVSDVPQWKSTGGFVYIPTKFRPRESKFAVFRNGTQKTLDTFSTNRAQKTKHSAKILEAFYRSVDEPDTDKIDVLPYLVKADGSPIFVAATTFKLKSADLKNGKRELYVKYRIGENVAEKTVPNKGIFSISHPADFSPSISPTAQNGRLGVRFEKTGFAQLRLSDGSEYTLHCDSLPEPIDISREWRVDFQKNRGAPDSAHFNELSDWTKNADDGIKYFSGIASYSKKIALKESFFKKGRRIMLSLGKVADLARVEINGKSVATLWKPPFECDITDAVLAGENELVVRVVNRWCNRLIGDARLAKSPDLATPKWLLKGESNNTDRYAYVYQKKLWKADDEPLESGLLGPVEITAADVIDACSIK